MAPRWSTCPLPHPFSSMNTHLSWKQDVSTYSSVNSILFTQNKLCVKSAILLVSTILHSEDGEQSYNFISCTLWLFSNFYPLLSPLVVSIILIYLKFIKLCFVDFTVVLFLTSVSWRYSVALHPTASLFISALILSQALINVDVTVVWEGAPTVIIQWLGPLICISWYMQKRVRWLASFPGSPPP